VPNAFSGKRNQQKNAFFQPLTILGIEAYHKNKGTLERFKEVRIEVPFQTIPQDIYKTTITLFLSDVLHHALKEDGKNETLFTFLETALTWLDTHQEISNFHLITLLQLTRYLGFYPQTNSERPFFEMTEGVFVPFQSLTCLSEEETNWFKKLVELKFSDEQKLFSGKQRKMLLKILLDYYTLNIEGFQKPKSLEVLKEVFE
jgi:DNA repair protein RecO (recombination protein O)